MNQEERQQELEWALLSDAVAKLRASIMAVAFGLTAGVGLFVATIWLVIRGGRVVGPTLGLLNNYLPGYTVTWGGAFIGFFYAALIGAALGWVIAFIYNRIAMSRSTKQFLSR